MSILDDVSRKFTVPMSQTDKGDKSLSVSSVSPHNRESQNISGQLAPIADEVSPIEHCRKFGSPSWWQSDDSPAWHCGHCELWPQPFLPRRTVVAASDVLGKH